jgi:GNAT superfamily N-acetyltransferase
MRLIVPPPDVRGRLSRGTAFTLAEGPRSDGRAKELTMSPLRKHDMRLRPATTEDIKAVWDERWYGLVVGLNTIYTPSDVQGLALVDDLDELVGLVTYHTEGPAGQIVTLDTILRGRGFGRRLLEDVESKFHRLGLGRAWALMTNDNLRAAGLYLSRGYRLVRVHLDAVDRVREHKPKLPEKGYEGIPIRDLWEFEKMGPLGIPVP